MTNPQMRRTADFFQELAVASTVGGAGDLVIVGSRLAMDILGIGLGGFLFSVSLWWTGRAGRSRL